MRIYIVTIPGSIANMQLLNADTLPATETFDTDDAMLEFTAALEEAGVSYGCVEQVKTCTTREQVPVALSLLGLRPRAYTAAVTRVTEYRVEAYSRAHADRKAHDGDWEGEVGQTTTDVTITEDEE